MKPARTNTVIVHFDVIPIPFTKDHVYHLLRKQLTKFFMPRTKHPRSLENAIEDVLNLTGTKYHQEIEMILLNLYESAQRDWRVDHEAQRPSEAGKLY